MCVVLAFVLASLTLAIRVPVAHATDLVPITTCGQSVSTDAILARNLTCAGDGVIVTGDGVILDLGGHVIRSSTGTGRGVAIEGPCGSTATVRGPGKVRGFRSGINALRCSLDAPRPDLRYPHHVLVNGVQLLDNTSGIQVFTGPTDITATTIRGTHGIVTDNPYSNGSDSLGSVSIDTSSITSTGVAFRAANRSHIHVRHSTLRGGAMSLQADSSFQMEDSTLRNATFWCSETGVDVKRSLLVDNSLEIGSFCGGHFTGSTFRSTSGGAAISPYLTGNDAQTYVVVDGNRFSGWDTAIEVGRYVHGIQITNNRFEGNTTAVRAQHFTSNSDCLVGWDYGWIRTNTFVRNGGDAVVLDCGEWTVGGNVMKNNGGLGINASGPLVQVTDEGGNVARGNAEPQCIGVVCLRR